MAKCHSQAGVAQKMKKNNLLTISELTKLTDANIYSLRYYERIGVLKPAFVDSNTGYRYYSFEQIFHVKLILFCIELDIPLKELVHFTDNENTIDYLEILSYGKKIAESKLQKIQKGLDFIRNAEQQIIKSNEPHLQQSIYSRKLVKKYLHVIPYDKPFGGLNQFEEVAKAFLNFEYSDDEDYDEFSEFGLLYEYSQSRIQRYIFVELSKPKRASNVKIIPKGEYLCKLSEEIQIENSAQIFNDYLNNFTSFIAIETPFYAGKFEIDKPISELRVYGSKATN